MLNVDDYKDFIISALFNENIIDKELYLKCNPVISELPYDLRTTDIDELMERMDDINERINERDKILSDAEYRIGVKQRDVERLNKRMEKSSNNMEKAIDNINKESDKIVNGITKLENKLSKLDLSDSESKSLKESVDKAIDKFKKSHNKFFEMDLTPNNITTYSNEFDSLKASGNNLDNLLKNMFNQGLITKTDMNNGNTSKSIGRIEKNIATYSKNNKSMEKDGQKIKDDFTDIDYITRESKTVITSRNALSEEYDRTLQTYLDNGGDRSVKPGFNQSGQGTRIPELIDDIEKQQKELGKKFPYHFT